MVGKKSPLDESVEICSHLALIRDKMRVAWCDMINDMRMLWPIATFSERLKLAGFFPFSLIAGLWWSLTSACWLLLGNLALTLTVRAAQRGPDGEIYGIDLAQAVADRLVEDSQKMTGHYGACVTFHHRDYCGQGLFYGWATRDGFQLSHSEDGYPSTIVLQFNTRAAFVDWLAAQSNLSLSGVIGPLKDRRHAGNQRITKNRLIDYIAG